MSAVQFFLPYQAAVKPTNVGAPGAPMYVYAPGTTTLRAVYATSALTTQLSNPVIADGAGRFPDIYLDNALTYKIVINDKNGALLYSKDPYIPGEAPDASALQPYQDAAEAAALDASGSAATATTQAGIATTQAGIATTNATVVASYATSASAALIAIEEALATTSFTIDDLALGLPVNPMWLGAVGDGATNDFDSVAATVEFLGSIAVNVSTNGFYKASTGLFVPARKFYMGADTLEITHTFELLGVNSSGQQGNAYASWLKWDDGATAIRVQRYNTSGASTLDGVTHFAGDGFKARNIRITGGYSGTEAEYHGIHAKARFIAENVMIDGFSGDGIFSNADTGGGGSTQGNTNNTRLDTVYITNCRDGVSRTGGDSNVWTEIDVDVTGNRRWGRNYTDFLGGQIFGGHAADNGLIPGTAPSVVSNGGNRYAVVYGQEPTASVTAPSGTADTANWYYLGAGGVNTGLNIPAWVSGMTLRAGGAAHYANFSAQTLVLASYTEGGQGPIQATYGATIIGGTQGAGVRGTAVWQRNLAGAAMFSPKVGAGLTQNDSCNLLPNGIEWYRLSTSDDITWEFFGNSLALTALRSGVSSVWAMEYLCESTTNDVGKRKINFPNGYGLGNKKRFPATVTPVGARVVGDHDENTAPTATTPLRWITTGAGTPGTQIADYPYLRADPTTGVGYVTGAGGAVTQATSRTTGVTLNKVCGAITLVSAAGSASWQSFTVTNSAVAATDTVRVVQKSGTDKNMIHVTAVGAGSFEITFATTGGTTTEQPVFNFSVFKAVAA